VSTSLFLLGRRRECHPSGSVSGTNIPCRQRVYRIDVAQLDPLDVAGTGLVDQPMFGGGVFGACLWWFFLSERDEEQIVGCGVGTRSRGDAGNSSSSLRPF
jgi:hypothetical protein